MKQVIETGSGLPLTILLLEDDDGDAKMVTRAFSNANITNPLVRVVDGVDALELLRGDNLREKLTKPYVIISDINMPRMNGITFLQELRKDPNLNRSVVFMLTTSKDPGDVFLAYESHVAGYITKETAGKDFLDLIKLMSLYWELVEVPVVYKS